jgi:cardiolipin synthase A/B
MSTWTYVLLALYALALPCAARAIMQSRTPQGAAAWTVALLGFPYLSVPLYVIFGRSKFNGYRVKRQVLDRRAREELSRIEKVKSHEIPAPTHLETLVASVEASHQVGFTGGNRINLLVDAERAYPVMLEEIERAERYILFQFYIFREDQTGLRFVEALMAKARAGIEVNFLYDEIGSSISRKLFERMKNAGVKVAQFNATKGPQNRFQINFRNHRKLLIVDGRVAIAGGMNIGDDYLGLDPEVGAWRDTQVRLEGPAVMALQTSFAKDWFWSQGKLLRAQWDPWCPPNSNAEVLCLHTGPVDDRRTCLQAHLALINMAHKRLWIATPYLVLPDSLSDALALAALRGVDLRIMVPSRGDNLLVDLASSVYQAELLAAGARLFRFDAGFLHQKAMVVDDRVAVVGSANLDYRSMFLNFEISVMSTDSDFVAQTDQMLSDDFNRSRELRLQDFEGRSFGRRLLERSADLFAPIL